MERRRLALAIGLGVVAVAVARLAIALPTFLHANFHGGPLAEAILEYPAHQMGRESTFGRFGFALLGGVTRLFGRRFEVVSTANQCFAAATSFVMAWMAYRYTRNRWSAAFVLAVAALHVPVVRVAASEDAHTLAVLLGWLAFWGFDVYAERGRRVALTLATAALILMINTRQTLYVFVPCAYALALARGGWQLVRRPELYASAALVLLAIVWRASTTFGTQSEQTSFIIIALILTTPKLLLDIVAHHPLLDVIRFGPGVTLLLLCGLVHAWRERGVLRALVGAFAFCFLVSLPTAWHTPGVELAFRLPATTVGLVLCGVGGGWLADRIRDRRILAALALAVGLSPLVLPSFGELRRQSADFLEYRFVRSVAPAWPRELVLVELPRTPSMPSYSPSLGLLRRAGIQVLREGGRQPPDRSVPRVFLAGVQCWAWSMGELIGFRDEPSKIDRARLEQWGSAAVDGDLRRLSIPRQRRGECDQLLAHAKPIGPGGAIPHPSQDEPFAIYGVESIPLQLYQLDMR